MRYFLPNILKFGSLFKCHIEHTQLHINKTLSTVLIKHLFSKVMFMKFMFYKTRNPPQDCAIGLFSFVMNGILCGRPSESCI